MKKFSPIKIFFSGSLLVILIFTLLFWNFYQNNPEKVDHVRLEDWARPVKLASNVPSVAYNTLFSEDSFDLFTVKEDRDSRDKFLTQTKFDYNGEILEENQIDRAGQLSFPESVNYQGADYLFYFSGDSSRNQDLIVKNLDNLDSLVLMENTSFSTGLSYVETEDTIILAYTAMTGDTRDDIISVVGFDPENEQRIFSYSYPFELKARYPKLAKIEDQIFMIWHERNPETMFISGQEGTINRYFLKAGELDPETGEIKDETILADAYGNGSSNVDISQTADKILISWVEYDRDIEKEFINLGSLNAEGEFEKFSSENDSKILGINPSISFTGDNKLLVKSVIKRMETPLFLNNISGREIEAREQRIFPNFQTSRASKLYSHQGEQHLLWTEAASTGRDIYYSNTATAEEIKLSELLGFSAVDGPMEFLSSLILFFGFPIIGFNLFLLNYYIPLIIVIIVLYLLGKISNRFYQLKHSTPYLTFLSFLTAIFLFILFFQGELQYLFAMSEPPASHRLLIVGIITFITIVSLRVLRYEDDHSFFIGVGSVFLWFYWLAQAGLVYEFYQYFI